MKRDKCHRNSISLKQQLQSQVAGSNWSPKSALLELIDNAVDAGASYIEISTPNNCIVIEDNGKGSSVPYVILEPHNREETHGGKGTGQFGIGGAYATIYLTDIGRVEAISVNNGVERSVSANWGKLGDEDTEFPTEMLHPDTPTNKQNGTCVTMYGVSGKRRGKNVMDAVAKELGMLYKPGITDGLKVTICGNPVSPPFTPELIEPAIIETIELKCGMTFRARMGLLKQGVNESCNRVYYGPRLMENGPDLLSGCKTNTSRIMFEAYLQPDECRKNGLKVSTTKESLASGDETVESLLDEMRVKVVSNFNKTIEAANEQVQQFRLTFMSTAITNAVKGALSHKPSMQNYQPGEASERTASNRKNGEQAVNADPREIGNEDTNLGEFSIDFRLEYTSGDAGAIAIELKPSALLIRVNTEKRKNRTPENEIDWMLGAIPGLIRAKLYDWGTNRTEKMADLINQNPSWQYLLDTKKRGGHGTTPMLVEIFNDAREQAMTQLAGCQKKLLNSL